ncbi:hypothetical protein [Enterococcus sp. DIV0170]|uniref:hypothetical protein n=1 Tax=Enterococcus sp. DIV0170 TaxID=2774642 RepID=UPI003F253588
MQTQRLGQRQLLNMMKGNLEKRILQVYSETKDVPSVIEYAVALLVRHALSVADFSFMCHELIRELFLTAVPCTTMRRFSVFFEAYFDEEEWRNVVDRLYKDEQDYLAATAEARASKGYLKEKDSMRADELANHQFILRSTFKGANDRKHIWTLKNAHPVRNEEELVGALKILTMLTIFETNGVRKFTEFVEVFRDALAPDLHYVEEQEEPSEADEDAFVKSEQKINVQKGTSSMQKANERKKSPVHSNKEEFKGLNHASAPKRGENPESNVLAGSSIAVRPPERNVGISDRVKNTSKKKSKDGKQKNKQDYFGKSEEQVIEGRNERKLKQRVAKLLGKKKRK